MRCAWRTHHQKVFQDTKLYFPRFCMSWQTCWNYFIGCSMSCLQSIFFYYLFGFVISAELANSIISYYSYLWSLVLYSYLFFFFFGGGRGEGSLKCKGQGINNVITNPNFYFFKKFILPSVENSSFPLPRTFRTWLYKWVYAIKILIYGRFLM